ncbi:MAG: HD domain-containing protein, partial [Candidatus Omnitrophica bacterium]|nr:HD domain-containing protein [Candidatus Omnitrophota bacterium]
AEVFLVGGALRNFFLEKENDDFDFATSKNAIRLARVFAKKIHGAFVLLDEEHCCARVARKEKGSLLTFDFADFRVPTLQGDLAHRDFTVNTLAVDIKRLSENKPLKEILIDTKRGLADLAKKKIKMVSVKAFAEDPLRMMRAFSLKAGFDFKIEKKTLARIKKDKKLLSNVARERVRDELFKVLASSAAFNNLKAMHRVGLLEEFLPQISIMYHLPQGGYHHLSLLEHSFEAVRQVEKAIAEFSGNIKIRDYLNEELASGRNRASLMKFAALLHDIGKPETCRKEKGKMTFHGHEHSGRYIVRNIAKMLKLSSLEKNTLEMLVLHHLRPGYLSNFKNPTPRAIFRYFRDTKNEAPSVALLSLADQRSTLGPLTTENDLKHHEQIARALLTEYFDKKEVEKPVRLISGDHLIKELKMKPSPIFKKILSAIEEKHALGEITTKAEALALARRIAK